VVGTVDFQCRCDTQRLIVQPDYVCVLLCPNPWLKHDFRHNNNRQSKGLTASQPLHAQSCAHLGRYLVEQMTERTHLVGIVSISDIVAVCRIESDPSNCDANHLAQEDRMIFQ